MFFGEPGDIGDDSPGLLMDTIEFGCNDVEVEPPVVQKRKRGRPPKNSKPPTHPVKSPHPKGGKGSLDGFSDDSEPFDSESEALKRRRSRVNSADFGSQRFVSPGGADASIRRSNRGRKLDLSRPLVILLPDMDPRDLFDISSELDWESLQAALAAETEPFEGSDPEYEDHHHVPMPPPSRAGEKVEVYTPSVIERKHITPLPSRPHPTPAMPAVAKKKSRTVKELPTSEQAVNELSAYYGDGAGLYDESYMDYDANSDDEAVAVEWAALVSAPGSSAVSTRLLERMMCRLERELELARLFAVPIADCLKTEQLVQVVLTQSHETQEGCRLFCQGDGSIDPLLDIIKQDCSFGRLPPTPSTLPTLPGPAGVGVSVGCSSLSGSTSSSSLNNLPELVTEVEGESAVHANTPRGATQLPAATDKKAPNGLDNLRVMTLSDVQKWVPESRAVEILRSVVASVDNAKALRVDDVELLSQRAYEHWVRKSVGRRQSLLRAHHKFRMHLWQPAHRSSLPSAADFSSSSLLTSYQQLLRVRRDLDRARLIVDRVRRREKIKKDILRCSMDLICVSGVFGTSVPMRPAVATTAGAPNCASGSGEGLPPQGQRKRGRPRRADSISSQPATPARLMASQSASMSLSSGMPMGSFLLNSKMMSSANASAAAAKIVQGRDKFGKFLRKAPPAGSLASATETALLTMSSLRAEPSAASLDAVAAYHDSTTHSQASGEDLSHAMDFAAMGSGKGLQYDSEDNLSSTSFTEFTAEGPGGSAHHLRPQLRESSADYLLLDPGMDEHCLNMIAELPQLLSDPIDPTA